MGPFKISLVRAQRFLMRPVYRETLERLRRIVANFITDSRVRFLAVYNFSVSPFGLRLCRIVGVVRGVARSGTEKKNKHLRCH